MRNRWNRSACASCCCCLYRLRRKKSWSETRSAPGPGKTSGGTDSLRTAPGQAWRTGVPKEGLQGWSSPRRSRPLWRYDGSPSARSILQGRVSRGSSGADVDRIDGEFGPHHPAAIAARPEQRCDCLIAGGVHDERCKLLEGFQDKTPVFKLGMRYGELFVRIRDPVVEENIDVDLPVHHV